MSCTMTHSLTFSNTPRILMCEMIHSKQVVRGPAPLSLALAKRVDQDGTVILLSWTETDFRDGKPPWWKA